MGRTLPVKPMPLNENQGMDAMRIHLDTSAFTLSTGDADMLRTGSETEQGSVCARHYRLTGEMHPVDPAGEPGRFRASLHNFGYPSGEKTCGAVRAIIRRFHGAEQRRIFIQGGANGGHEVLKAILRYPEDCDGAVCFVPALNWTGKALLDSRNAKVLSGGWMLLRSMRSMPR